MIHENLTTLTRVLKNIVWSCNVAFSSVYPSCDMNGGPLTPTKQERAGMSLANGVCWACAELKGDWLWHQRTWRLKDIPVARNICFLCDACSDDRHRLRYYDDTEDAPWRATEVDAATFINRKVRPGRSTRSFLRNHRRQARLCSVFFGGECSSWSWSEYPTTPFFSARELPFMPLPIRVEERETSESSFERNYDAMR